MIDSSKDPRSNNFNLLRLVLASAVILGHSPELIDGDRHREPVSRIFGGWLTLGTLAVDGFFLLSGYLIAQSWAREPRLGPYLLKRVRRIYPGFTVACLVCCLGLACLGSNPRYWQDFRPGPFLAGLATLAMPAVPDAFVGLHYPDINGVVWTIRYEFLCYLGLALLGLSGLLGRRLVVLALAIGATAWSLAQDCLWIPTLPVLPNSPRLASFFLAGISFYLFRDRVRFTRIGIVSAAVVLFLALFRFKTPHLALPGLGGYLLLAAAFGPLVPGTALIRREDVSYGTYLYAWPIQELLILHRPGISPPLLFAIALPISMAAGSASWWLIERPAMRYRRSRPAPIREVATAVDHPA